MKPIPSRMAFTFLAFGLSAVLVACSSSKISKTTAQATDTTPPTIASLTASPSSITAAGQQETLSVSVSDNVGVSKVEFYRVMATGTNPVTSLIYTDTASPYQLTFAFSNGTQNGTYSYLVKAYDAANNTSTSGQASYQVNLPVSCSSNCPTVSLSASPSTLTSAGTSTLAASTTNTNKVEFYRKNANGSDSLIYTDTVAPFALPLSFTASQNGTYNYFAKALKSDGASATSSVASVVVNIGSACTSAVCEGFESYSSMPAGNWLLYNMTGCTNGAISIDSTTAKSGSHSVKVVGGPNYCDHGFFGLNDISSVSGGPFYVRFYMKMQTAIPNMHVTFLTMKDTLSSSGTSLRLGGQMGVVSWNRESDDATIPSMSPVGIGTSSALPANQWNCIEYKVDGTAGTLAAWINNTSIAGLTLDTTATPDIDSAFLSSKPTWKPQVSNLYFGWEAYGSIGNTLWFDDVVVSSSKVGCL